MPLTITLLLHVSDILGFITTRLESNVDRDEIELMRDHIKRLHKRLSREVQEAQERAG